MFSYSQINEVRELLYNHNLLYDKPFNTPYTEQLESYYILSTYNRAVHCAEIEKYKRFFIVKVHKLVLNNTDIHDIQFNEADNIEHLKELLDEQSYKRKEINLLIKEYNIRKDFW